MSDVFWIERDAKNPSARLAIVLRPRGHDLHDELLHMKNGGIRTLVSMLEYWEADYLGLADEEKIAEQIGLNFLSFPIPDRTTPPHISTFRYFIGALAARIRIGDAVGVHCRGCIGRSTIAVACTLIHLGWNPAAALKAVESTRGCPVPDTEEQREWILRYEAQP